MVELLVVTNLFSHQSFTVRALASWVPAPAIWWNASAAKRRAKKICPWLSRCSWLGWSWGGWLAGLDFFVARFFFGGFFIWPVTGPVVAKDFRSKVGWIFPYQRIHEKMVDLPAAGVVSGLWLGRWCVYIWMCIEIYIWFDVYICIYRSTAWS